MITEPQALSGKFALVTRGSYGIGAAIVRRLARDGASVAFTQGDAWRAQRYWFWLAPESLEAKYTATGSCRVMS